MLIHLLQDVIMEDVDLHKLRVKESFVNGFVFEGEYFYIVVIIHNYCILYTCVLLNERYR